MEGEYLHRWAAKLGSSTPWIRLQWDKPVRASEIQITFDTGFQRELTLSGSDGVTDRTIRGPQPETVRDYTISVTDATGKNIEMGSIRNNYQRLRRHQFRPMDISSLTIHVEATNGSEYASIYEVRAY